jgi:transposase
MNFSDWREALPFALGIGKAYARKFPIGLDAESAIMESLWRSQQRGAEFTKGYVYLRAINAINDEARRMAEGGRGTYQDVGAFVDIDDQWDLSADSADPIEAIDRRRLLESMPPAAVTLIRNIAGGETQDQMAERYQVSAPRICQVLTDLKARPLRPRQLPGHVDLKATLASFAKQELRRRIGRHTNITKIASALGVCRHTAYQWAHGAMPNVRGDGLKANAFRDAIRGRALEIVGRAFERSNGEWIPAAKLLGVSQMTAYRWGKLLPEGLMPDRSTRRPDLPTERFAELRAQGLSHYAIAKRLGVSERTVFHRLYKQKALRKCQP